MSWLVDTYGKIITATQRGQTIVADFPKYIAFIATYNGTVNTENKPGRGKPIDQMMEHYNL
jgi:hypothetical protein